MTVHNDPDEFKGDRLGARLIAEPLWRARPYLSTKNQGGPRSGVCEI